MITLKQAEKLLSMVTQTRAAQKQYFETRDKYDLFRAKDWERDLDNYLRKLTYEQGIDNESE